MLITRAEFLNGLNLKWFKCNVMSMVPIVFRNNASLTRIRA